MISSANSPPLTTGLQEVMDGGNFLDFIAFFMRDGDEYL